MSVCNKKVIPYPLRAFGGSRPGVVKKKLVMKKNGKAFHLALCTTCDYLVLASRPSK